MALLKKILVLGVVLLGSLASHSQEKPSDRMDNLWDGTSANIQVDTTRGALFRDGNYAMFIHWGLYSHIGNEWKGKTYYGIGEWIMNRNMADIPVTEYLDVATAFNPVNFDARAVAGLAKKAGMKYIIITSKHHDGFSMFHSRANKRNIVDATPFNRDPMKELAAACRDAGLGFGFYYSQNQDWTTPGGAGGPQTDADGNPVSFDEYFHNKCLPEVEQITTAYGPIALVWFDTPGDMDKQYAEKLVVVVHRNQPGAYVSGRVGHGMGDYTTFGDMEIPHRNMPGIWETVDVTNDSWGYAWYDQNWKSPKTILRNVISTVARGGTYMLNVGPAPDGTVPGEAQYMLETAGDWIAKHPEVIYRAEASPWGQALPWGDAVVNDGKILVAVYDWPASGHLYLPGVAEAEVSAIHLKGQNGRQRLAFHKKNGWLDIQIPTAKPDPLVSVIELSLKHPFGIDTVPGVDPQLCTGLTADFAIAENSNKAKKSWMEKFGEWKHIMQVGQLNETARVHWDVDILEPGYYNMSLTYSGAGRLVWQIATDEGNMVQNQQNSSPVYHEYPIGWLKFETSGKHRVTVTLLEGDAEQASLKAIRFMPVISY